MKQLVTILIIATLVVTTACGVKSTESKPELAPRPSPIPNSQQVVDSSMIEEQPTNVKDARANFSFSLYPPMLQDQANKNVLISPVSIMLALTMAYNGADGETQAAMATALQLVGISLEEINQANQSFIQTLKKSDEDVQLKVANSLWAREGVAFEETFMNNIRAYYDAEVQALDFNQPNAADTINQWVSDKTNEKIKQIVDNPINSDTILFLINAIYFNGKWEKPFDEKLTEDDTFNMVNATTKQHPFMKQSGEFNYYEEDTFQAVKLPYGNGDTSMYVFLPHESSSLQQFHEQLSADNWTKWLSSFNTRKGNIAVPKFKLEYELEMKNVLSAIGMGVAFDGGKADFTKFVVDKDSKLFISSVKHKTYIDVHEEGTEAAAVTSIAVEATSINVDEPEPFEMKVDRPFFIVIQDSQTDAILFMGSIYEPQL